MLPAVFYSVGVLGLAIHLWLRRREFDRADRLELATRWWLGVGGAWSLFAASGHLFAADDVARSIGWPPGSPFQREVGFANLAFGVMGLACIWIRGTYREATVTGLAVFLWGAAGGHIYEIMSKDNWAENNAGAILYLDILVPLVAAVILVLLRREERESTDAIAAQPLTQ